MYYKTYIFLPFKVAQTKKGDTNFDVNINVIF